MLMLKMPKIELSTSTNVLSFLGMGMIIVSVLDFCLIIYIKQVLIWP